MLFRSAVGVLPGIGPAMTLALLLPVTYSVGADSAIIMFAGIYYGGMYGGSTTSILLNTPGESSSVITAIEGNKMAKVGRAAQALATAAIGSFVAGTLSTVGLMLLAGFLNLTYGAMAQTLVQVHAPPALRGRLIGLYNLAGNGLRAFSGVTIGVLGGMIGIHWSLALSSMVLLATCLTLLAFAMRSR